MAEVYTVAIDNTTPVEITGGRVGSFELIATERQILLFLGGPNMAVQYATNPHVTDGLRFGQHGTVPVALYVTSPDEIYALIDQVAEGVIGDTLTIFHNR